MIERVRERKIDSKKGKKGKDDEEKGSKAVQGRWNPLKSTKPIPLIWKHQLGKSTNHNIMRNYKNHWSSNWIKSFAQSNKMRKKWENTIFQLCGWLLMGARIQWHYQAKWYNNNESQFYEVEEKTKAFSMHSHSS